MFKSEVGIWRGLEWSSGVEWSYGDVAHAGRRALHLCIHTHSAFIHFLFAVPKNSQKPCPIGLNFWLWPPTRIRYVTVAKMRFPWVWPGRATHPNPPPHSTSYTPTRPTMPINTAPFGPNIIGPLSSCFIFNISYPLRSTIQFLFACVAFSQATR